jgi:regulator of RNase E activity RraB
MATDYPNDSDGDALRRIECHSNMAAPMTVDFQIAVPDEAAATKIAKSAYELGYRCRIYDSQGASDWTCECSSRMLLTYEAVIAIQEELDRLARPFGGHIDGWGSFGNDPA